jgi:hypothetical protein
MCKFTCHMSIRQASNDYHIDFLTLITSTPIVLLYPCLWFPCLYCTPSQDARKTGLPWTDVKNKSSMINLCHNSAFHKQLK